MSIETNVITAKLCNAENGIWQLSVTLSKVDFWPKIIGDQIKKTISPLNQTVELLRSKFKRPTRKSRFMLTYIHKDFKVDIDDCALCHYKFTTTVRSILTIALYVQTNSTLFWQKLTWVLKLTFIILAMNLYQPKAQMSMPTLTYKSFSVHLECNVQCWH